MLVFKASAGSGKTYNLALQYILRLLLDGENAYRQILAVTFTKEATSEMKLRILADLYSLAAGLDENAGFMSSIKNELAKCDLAGKKFSDEKIRQTAGAALERILHDYSRFNVGTIDSFFQRVLRNLARELGKGSRFNVDLNQKKAVQEAVRAIIEKSGEDNELLEWLSNFIDDKIEQEKSWRIERDLESFGQNIFNEAFQQKQNQLWQLLKNQPDKLKNGINECKKIKYFFEKNIEELTKKFPFESYDKNDFFQGDKGVPSYFRKIKNKKYEEPNSYVKSVLSGEKGKSGDSQFLGLLADTEQFREKKIAEYISADLYLKNIYSLALLNYISTEIDAQSRDNNRFMLSQTAMLLSEMLDDDNDFSFVFEKIGAEVKNIMIDEFQDTSKLQWKNFRALLSGVVAAGDFSMLVGDVKQSIYRWRNGDWQILNNIENEKKLFLTPKNIVNLDTNFRSYGNVIEFNNAVFQKISAALADEYAVLFPNSEQNPFSKAYSDVAQKTAKNSGKGYVSVDFFESKEYENQAFERLIEILNDLAEKNYVANDICILCRTNRQVRAISNYLKSQQSENKQLAEKNYLNIISNEAFLLSSSSVLQLIISALRLINSPQNPVPLAELYFLQQKHCAGAGLQPVPSKVTRHGLQSRASEPYILTDLSPDKIFEFLPSEFQPQHFENLKMLPLYELILKIIYLFDLEKVTQQSAYIFAFLDAVFNYLKDHSSDIASFLNFWSEELNFQTVGSNSAMKGIKVMTIHKSKGLEFPCVILPFCFGEMAAHENGRKTSIVWCEAQKEPFDLPILPINYTAKMEKSLFKADYDREKTMLFMDNINVYYVAFTRAVKNLYIFSQIPPKTEKNLSFQTLLNQSLSQKVEISESLENDSFELGKLEINEDLQTKKDFQTEKTKKNVLKNQDVSVIEIDFCAAENAREKVAFLQSNKSKEFLFNEDGETNPYILRGNIMHRLFANIFTKNDVENAVESLIFDGIIAQNERENYIAEVKNAISQPNVNSWFNGSYKKVFNEMEILTKSTKKPFETFRPDRVMISENSVVVIDYKFGQQKTAHKNQVSNYIKLLKSMNYQNVSGRIWYVNENEVVVVEN
ncbi:MAG: UvrD-helicase domain-containing protein [Prevotellaceae bacterium]|jgi:ATP-dependent exoDNAse (exonuclease V) beta subunit|nr:UvrD-helicase domain-containing protein [Prevotellaceae bacterium]